MVSNDNFLSRSTAGQDSADSDMVYEGGEYLQETEFREITGKEIRDLESLTVAQRQMYWQGTATLEELVAKPKSEEHEAIATP